MVSLSSRIVVPITSLTTDDSATSYAPGPSARTVEARRTGWANAAVRSRFGRMSYLVLARKYRPQRFSELVGQEHVARTLSNAIAQNRVHHAFLFTGARGVGKTSAARILAKALSCEKGPTAEPCGDVRPVPGDRGRPLRRRHRDRRRVEHQGRGDQVDPRGGALPARARAAQGLHHRRGSHAVGAFVQCAAEDAGGAAAARRVRVRDDRGAQDSGHDPVALPALRLQADLDGAAGRAPRRHPAGREDQGDAGRGAPDRAPGGRVGARRAVAARPGDRLRRARGADRRGDRGRARRRRSAVARRAGGRGARSRRGHGAAAGRARRRSRRRLRRARDVRSWGSCAISR